MTKKIEPTVSFKASDIEDAYRTLNNHLPWDVVDCISNLVVENGTATCNVKMSFPNSLSHNEIMDLMFEFIESYNDIEIIKVPHAQ